METTTKEHLGWIDLLRVLACFLVVLSHCCDPFVAQFDADRSAFLTGMFTGSTVRCCVPLFVMMTGVLLLPVQTGMVRFLPQADRENRTSAGVLVAGAARALLRLSELRRNDVESSGRDGGSYAAGHADQALYVRFQFQL